MKGIGGRLWLAFLVLAILPVFGAVVVWIATNSVQTPLDIATERNLAFSDNAARLSKTVQALIAQVGDSVDEGEPDWPQVRRNLQLSVQALRTEAAALDVLQETDVGKSFQAIVNELGDSVNELIGSGDQLRQQRPMLRQAVEQVKDAAELLTSRTLNVRGTAADKALDSKDQALVELRFGVRSASIIAATVIGSQSRDGIDVAAGDYASLIRDLVFQVSVLQDDGLRAELAAPLRQLFTLGAGEDNLFVVARSVVQASETNRQVASALRDRLNDLELRISAEELKNNASAREVLRQADGAFSVMRLTLLLSAMVSVLLAIAIAYWYVHRGLLRRLRRLSDATDRLQQGKLGEPVSNEGNDELSVIAEGLEVFRGKALQLSDSEAALQARTADLEQVNAELDKFAYVASHDLRAPLRAVENLASFIKEDVGDDLPEESRKHLDLMSSRIKRLDSLLTALLEYSRVGRTELAVEQLDFGEVLAGVGDIIVRDGFSLQVGGRAPVFYSYRAPLEQVVRNLIDNAQKHHDQEHGTILVDYAIDDGYLVFDVTDDGPGIERKFHERVFGMFQTLKPRDDTEGSGMGLAILLKLAHSFGGQIRLESDPEASRGTTFHVMWPVFSDADKTPWTGS